MATKMATQNLINTWPSRGTYTLFINFSQIDPLDAPQNLFMSLKHIANKLATAGLQIGNNCIEKASQCQKGQSIK